MWSRYLTRTGYLPILAMTYLLVSPFVSRYVIHVEQYQERARIETSIKSQTQATDKIYVWDNQSGSYQSSERYQLVNCYHRSYIWGLPKIVLSWSMTYEIISRP